MYNAVIDNGSTYLFLDNGNDDVYSGEIKDSHYIPVAK